MFQIMLKNIPVILFRKFGIRVTVTVKQQYYNSESQTCRAHKAKGGYVLN